MQGLSGLAGVPENMAAVHKAAQVLVHEFGQRAGRCGFQAGVRIWPACLQDKITDKLGLLERRASLLLKIPGRAGNAEANFRCGGVHGGVEGTGQGSRSLAGLR